MGGIRATGLSPVMVCSPVLRPIGNKLVTYEAQTLQSIAPLVTRGTHPGLSQMYTMWILIDVCFGWVTG